MENPENFDDYVNGSRIYGPVIVFASSVVVVILCCLFCRIDPEAPHSTNEEVVVEVVGCDNKGFERDDVSRSSRRTTTTEVGEDGAPPKKGKTKKKKVKKSSSAAAKKQLAANLILANNQSAVVDDEAHRKNVQRLLKLAMIDETSTRVKTDEPEVKRPKSDRPKLKRKIERVETDDTTSIDTTPLPVPDCSIKTDE